MYVCTICCIYNFVHSCLSFCVMRFSLLRFGPHVSCVSVRVPLVLLKNSLLCVILKYSQALKISHQPRLAAITIPIPIPPSSHPSIHPTVYPVVRLSSQSAIHLVFGISY